MSNQILKKIEDFISSNKSKKEYISTHWDEIIKFQFGDKNSNNIIDELKNIKISEYTKPIQFGSNFLILKIENKKRKKIQNNKDKMLKQMIEFETNKQLNQYSNIYFNKIKINYTIDEK